MKRIIITIILINTTLYAVAFAGWSENVRLTFRGNEILPQIIARNDTVHVMWQQMGYGYVSYIRSTDGGNSWGPLVDLTAPTGHIGTSATLNLGDRGLLVSWNDHDTIQGINRIGLAKSTNNGESWNQLFYYNTHNPNNFGRPVSAVNGDSIFLVYFSQRYDSTSQSPIVAVHSYNYGQTWSDEVTLGHYIQLAGQPTRMKYCNGNLLLAFSCVPDSNHLGHLYILGHRNIDAGRTWSDTLWISPDILYNAQNICLTCNKINSDLMVGYVHDRFHVYAFHGDIFATVSSDGGISWPNEFQATNNHTAGWPSFDYVADTIVAIWSDIQFNLQGPDELVFNRSNNGGITWQGEQRLTFNEGGAGEPSISFDNGNIHVVWIAGVPDGAYDIFYKRFTPDSSTNIINPEQLPLPIIYISAYPNPFNSNVSLSYSFGERGEIQICNIMGELVKGFVIEKGDGKINWDAIDALGNKVCSGIYFARAKSGEVEKSIKLIYLK